MQAATESLFEFHNEATQAFQQITPLDPNNLAIDEHINSWIPKALARIPLIRAKLDLNTEGGSFISETLDSAEELFLFKDCQQYWR